jgi:hypothetical protein
LLEGDAVNGLQHCQRGRSRDCGASGESREHRSVSVQDQGAIEGQQTCECDQNADELPKVNRDPSIAIGVLHEDHLVVVFAS